MAASIIILAVSCLTVSAAPPAPSRLYQQQGPAHLQQINSLDYYLDNPEVHNYYNQGQQLQQAKQVNVAAHPGQPARLETLEPDSEVELIPGAQTPQQPPQQTPVAPNVPGLLPGQRVFIVHMPVPGYRPGTIGGYQPVYIVAAAPQANAGFPGNGYQNTVFVDPSSGQVVAPVVGYPRGVAQPAQPGANPGLLLGAPLANRPYDLVYQDPAAYQPVYQGLDGRVQPRLPYLAFQGYHNGAPQAPQPAHENTPSEQKQNQAIVESKDVEDRRNRQNQTKKA